MKRVNGAGADAEGGAILVIFAVALVVLIGIAAIAVDGSFGFVQNRRAQNATDLAAFAAAQQLNSSTYCNGTAAPTTQTISAIIQKLVDDNDAGVGTNWNAQFLYANGQPIPGATFTPSTSTQPPPGACGVSISAAPVWKPFFAGIFGVHQLTGYATGSVSNSQQGTPIGIVALNEVGPHEVLGGGTGSFVVSGNIFLDTSVANQPWTSTSGGVAWDDAVDAKADSNLYVFGTIASIAGTYKGQKLWPLDWCFDASAPMPGSVAAGAVYQGGDPPKPLPSVQPRCSEGSVTVAYNAIDNSRTQITDPLSGSGAPPNPLGGANIACPNMSLQVYSSVSRTASQLLPGEYTSPVELTGSPHFADCSGYAGEAAYPGVYRFDQGLWINPAPGNTVTGSNVVIATEQPYPMGGNTLNGTTAPGNGAPCLPAGTNANAVNGGQSEVTSKACGGTSPTTYGVVAYSQQAIQPVSSVWGTGSNFSLIVGGGSRSSVTLSGPTTGAYAGTNGSAGLVFYQDPNTQANFGFDAEAGDAANIAISGVVYNASLSNYGNNAPLDYWDGSGGGIPFYAGGTLQTGYGTGWTGPAAPAPSAGSVKITGTAIVDDFNTDGATTITILGEPYTLPGGGKLSLIG